MAFFSRPNMLTIIKVSLSSNGFFFKNHYQLYIHSIDRTALTKEGVVISVVKIRDATRRLFFHTLRYMYYLICEKVYLKYKIKTYNN